MIEIKNVTKSYGKTTEKLVALNNVSATIYDRELVGIIGFSGAGKSTLIRQLSLIEKADSGSIFLEDVDLFKIKGKDLLTMRRQLGIVFQGYQLLQQKNVFDNIAFPLQLIHVPKEVIQQKVKDLIQLVGLQEKANVYPSQLSGGQKQRVAIARALASDPKLLLLDEPTSALDGVTTKSILDLLRKIHEKTHVTILIITHELAVVKAVCNRVIVMDDGKFIESGDVDTVFNSPSHPTTKLILSHHMGVL